MAENIAFLVARCRNAQRQRGREFLRNLSERTGLPLGELSLVEPTQAVVLRRDIERRIVQGVANGAVLRRNGLSFADADRIVRALGEADPDRVVYAFLCHAEELPFALRLGPFARAWHEVLRFDGDTVMVATPDLAKGLMVDVGSSDSGPDEYLVDTWGD